MKASTNIFKLGLKEFSDKILVGGTDFSELPSKAKYIQEMIKEASEEAVSKAAAIIEEARLKADGMLVEANSSVAAIQEATRKAAYDEGFSAGFDAGMNEGTVKAEQIFTEMMRGISKMLEDLERMRNETVNGEEERVVKFIGMLAHKLIQRDLSYDPNSFYEMIKQSIARLDHKVAVTIRLHPASADKLNELRTRLIAELPGLETLSIVGEESLSAGDVILESGQERQDLRIASQIDEVIKTLLA